MKTRENDFHPTIQLSFFATEGSIVAMVWCSVWSFKIALCLYLCRYGVNIFDNKSWSTIKRLQDEGHLPLFTISDCVGSFPISLRSKAVRSS